MRFPIGVTILSIFAVLWTAAGTHQLRRRWFAVFLSLSIVISSGVIGFAMRATPKHPAVFNAFAYTVSVAFEAVLILLAVAFLVRFQRNQFLLPIISIIVGLHFFGMVWALGSNWYWGVGAAMCLLPILTMSISPQRLWPLIIGVGCAVILWVSAVCGSLP